MVARKAPACHFISVVVSLCEGWQLTPRGLPHKREEQKTIKPKASRHFLRGQALGRERFLKDISLFTARLNEPALETQAVPAYHKQGFTLSGNFHFYFCMTVKVSDTSVTELQGYCLNIAVAISVLWKGC